MGLGLVLIIMLVGMFCLFTEFFLFPGITAAGILGALCLILAIYLGYSDFPLPTGHYIFAGSVVGTGLIFWLGVRKLSTDQYAIHNQIDSRVAEVDVDQIRPGDLAKAVSDLRPSGKAMIHGKRLEVFSKGEYIEAGTNLEIIKVSSSKILVKAWEGSTEV
jgi:membrane-bound ClpP family serine protease